MSADRIIHLGPDEEWTPWLPKGIMDRVWPDRPQVEQNELPENKNKCSHIWEELLLFRFTARYCKLCGVREDLG